MRNVVLILLLGCLFSQTSAVVWIRFGGMEYWIQPKQGDFKQATLACLDINSSLASVKTPELHAFLTEFMVPPDRYYIGLRRATTAGEFRWVDDTALNYTDWYAGQPNTLNGSCVLMEEIGTSVYEWHDYACSTQAGFICQRYVGNSTVSTNTKLPKNISAGGRLFPRAKPSSTSTQNGYATSSTLIHKTNESKSQLTMIAVLALLLFVSICVNIALFCRARRPSAKKISEPADYIAYEVPQASTSVRNHVYMNTEVSPNYVECENDYLAPMPRMSVQENEQPDPDYVEFHPHNNL